MGVIKHSANPVANLAGCFGNFLPDRREDRNDVGSGDPASRHVAQLREGVVFQTGQPLPTIDIAFPASFVLGMILGRLELFAILVLFLPSFWRN